MKVGSERQAATSPAPRISLRRRSAISLVPFVRGDPPKLALPWGGLLRQRYSRVRGQSSKATRGYANSAGDLMPRCSRKSRSGAQMLSQIALSKIAPWVPKASREPSRYFPTSKPSRNRPETGPKPSQNRPETVPRLCSLFFCCLLFVVCCLFFGCLRFAF